MMMVLCGDDDSEVVPLHSVMLSLPVRCDDANEGGIGT